MCCLKRVRQNVNFVTDHQTFALCLSYVSGFFHYERRDTVVKGAVVCSIILPQDLTSRPVSSCPKLSIETVSRFIFCCCSSIFMYFFHNYIVLSSLSRLVNLKNYNYTGLGDISNLFVGFTSVRSLSWLELCRLTGSSTF